MLIKKTTTTNAVPPEGPTFVSVADVPRFEPAFRIGGLRHLIFTKGEELEAAGVTCRFGRRLLINLPKFREFIASGRASVIAGRDAE